MNFLVNPLLQAQANKKQIKLGPQRSMIYFLLNICDSCKYFEIILVLIINLAGISITLLETHETLTKDLIFTRALSSLKEQYDEVCTLQRFDLIDLCLPSSVCSMDRHAPQEKICSPK
jgi:hypothetical protein